MCVESISGVDILIWAFPDLIFDISHMGNSSDYQDEYGA